MNTPIPHIGATLTSRRAIHAYTEAQREAIHHAERQALRQPEPANFCAAVAEHEPAVSPWIFWPAIIGFSLTLTFASYEFATRVVPVLREWLA